jgi:hypothetical protein
MEEWLDPHGTPLQHVQELQGKQGIPVGIPDWIQEKVQEFATTSVIYVDAIQNEQISVRAVSPLAFRQGDRRRSHRQ